MDTKVEKPKDEEINVANATTEADDEKSKVASKETRGIGEPRSGTKVETRKEAEPGTVMTATEVDDEASKVSGKETQQGIPKPQSDTRAETLKGE